MDRIEKLFRKISKNDRETLEEMLKILADEKERKTLRYTKLKGGDFYKLRKGRFRMIFHFLKDSKNIVVDSIKLRNEKTYKDF